MFLLVGKLFCLRRLKAGGRLKDPQFHFLHVLQTYMVNLFFLVTGILSFPLVLEELFIFFAGLYNI